MLFLLVPAGTGTLKNRGSGRYLIPKRISGFPIGYEEAGAFNLEPTS
jgi:hypothetical protein